MGNQISCASSLSIAIAPNTIRCIPSRPLVITVVNLANGRACQVEQAMKVGELMLEMPGYCVAHFDEHIMQGSLAELKSKRISALPADHDLCAHHLYFLLPIHRIHKRLSAQELHNIVAVTRLARCSTTPAPALMSTSRITPLSSLQYEEAESCITIEHTLQGLMDTGDSLRAKEMEDKVLKEEEKMKGNGIHGEPEVLLHRLRNSSRSRPWIPKLDTILES
eukprot:c18432_g1_i2 orf=150-815(-)